MPKTEEHGTLMSNEAPRTGAGKEGCKRDVQCGRRPPPARMRYCHNKVLAKKLENGRTLLTTEGGKWTTLGPEDYRLFLRGRIHENKKTFGELEEKGIVLTRKNVPGVIEQYRRKNAFLFAGTTLHVVELTSRCTQACTYCLANAGKEKDGGRDMDRDTAREVVDFIMQSPAKNVCIEFQGGEPLLNYDTLQFICEYSKKKAGRKGKRIGYNLVTNLKKMDDDILRYVIKNRINTASSLDGPKELHDSQRRSPDGSSSYEHVTYWVNRIQKEFGYHVGLLPTITRNSLPLWKEIIDEYVSLGMSCIPLRMLWRVGRGKGSWQKTGYTGHEFYEFWKKSVEYMTDLNRRGTRIIDDFNLYVLPAILGAGRRSYMCIRQPCGAASSQLAYTPEGDIYACDAARTLKIFRLSSVKKTAYADLILSRDSLAFRSIPKDVLQCEFCPYSPYCGTCAVHTYINQKNIVPKLPLDVVCQFRKKAFGYIFNRIIPCETYRLFGLKTEEAPDMPPAMRALPKPGHANGTAKPGMHGNGNCPTKGCRSIRNQNNCQ